VDGQGGGAANAGKPRRGSGSEVRRPKRLRDGARWELNYEAAVPVVCAAYGRDAEWVWGLTEEQFAYWMSGVDSWLRYRRVVNPAGMLSEEGVKALEKDAEMFREESPAWQAYMAGEMKQHGIKPPRGW